MTYPTKADGMTIAINYQPKDSPWGGGNQVAKLLVDYLLRQGHGVTFRLTEDVDRIVLFKPEPYAKSSFHLFGRQAPILVQEILRYIFKPFQQVKFLPTDVAGYVRAHPQTLVVHRINECDRRKGTQGVDLLLSEANEVAHRTVFISKWLMDYHNWSVPEQYVITNGCDHTVFFPSREWDGKSVFRVVTHHWSPNWNKGFRAYQAVDEVIATGDLEGVLLTVVGQWPQDCRWRSARLVKPLQGQELADELRRHHAYITASLWEPCGMHHVEAASCGLPIAYHRDGGAIPEMCSRYGVEFSDDPVGAIRELRARYIELREKALAHRPSLGADIMCRAYAEVLGI